MTPEGQILRAITDYLTVSRILHFRMNTGAMVTDNRFVRFGVKGMADVLAFPLQRISDGRLIPTPVWLEVKAQKGKQSPYQREFGRVVTEQNHIYAVVRSIEDVKEVLG